MIRTVLAALPIALLLSGPSRAGDEARSVLDFTVADIEGNEVDLSSFQGEVLLIVNTASYCGYTPQYEGLEELYRTYGEKGFKVLAFPANEFGQQEPGTNAEIRSFCKSNYQVTFPLFSKIVVKGSGIHPLYAFLTDQELHPQFGGPIRWNFTKFLVDRAGNVVARFEPGDDPKSDKVVDAIEKALAESN
ncbi:glutathione peroxidase [Tautonia sociabilis]|uniref:Glutathione peroxidase n=1 Tax=Tautonia sociabilis TaxID=2080755 RepID=A0A432MIU3_9BACT|nr:glutathione peroxidase [Tautonia sociabilis]RUL87150.1 glutathione peroxidase [Tautonia sociabilis]